MILPGALNNSLVFTPSGSAQLDEATFQLWLDNYDLGDRIWSRNLPSSEYSGIQAGSIQKQTPELIAQLDT